MGMKRSVVYIPLDKIKSKWYKDIFTEWQPNKEYVAFVKSEIRKNNYIPPIVVVREDDLYYIVNGHHRYFAHAEAGKEKIKCIVIKGTFDESEPLRKAEVLLKEFDKKTGYSYQLSGYLDRWAAAVEKHKFVNKFKPTAVFRIYMMLKKIKDKLLGK